MVEASLLGRGAAVADFRKARRRAALVRILSQLGGQSNELFSYDEVRNTLKGKETSIRELRNIPLDAIVGSVGRYKEFTRGFLPGGAISPDRWANVKMAMSGLTGVPPIEVYQIGEAYFVRDGNHRVSVAKEMGLRSIEAYVTPVQTKVPLSADTDPDGLILKGERATFLEETRFDELCPDVELRVTVPGRYSTLRDQISLHRHLVSEQRGRQMPLAEAVRDWYESVYTPTVALIHEAGLLHEYSHRTETDLYVWICEHRAELETRLGWAVSPEQALSDLSSAGERTSRERPAARRLRAALDATIAQRGAVAVGVADPARADRVVEDVLVVIDDQMSGMEAVEQALVVAREERARLRGLLIIDERTDPKTATTLREGYERRGAVANMYTQLAVEGGDFTEVVAGRARWADIVVVGLSKDAARAGLKTRMRKLLHLCSRPILVVPKSATALDRVVLAFDDSLKAEQALYIAAYMAGWWRSEVTVITVAGSIRKARAMQAWAKGYMESCGVTVTWLQAQGDAATRVLEAATQQQANLIVLGGYALGQTMESVLGSVVNEVLRNGTVPVLICT